MGLMTPYHWISVLVSHWGHTKSFKEYHWSFWSNWSGVGEFRAGDFHIWQVWKPLFEIFESTFSTSHACLSSAVMIIMVPVMVLIRANCIERLIVLKLTMCPIVLWALLHASPEVTFAATLWSRCYCCSYLGIWKLRHRVVKSIP